MKKQTKYFAVLSAAAIMALTPAFSGLDHTGRVLAASYGWTEENGQLAYYDEDGYLTTDSWRKNGDDWYYLDEEGSIARNQKIDDYYVGEDGKMVKNTWVELQNEDEMDSPETPASYWYYFDKNGKIVTSRWMAIQNNWHYFDEDGIMQTGVLELDGSVYYLGKESDGVRKTGWILLEDITEDTDDEGIWCYFDEDGKLVVNQIDRKIDGAFYTFENGQMQTGWVKTEKTAEGEADSPASYQYYDEEQGGKRASGWYQIEGIEGISEEGEEYYFYFKNGKPYYSQEAGLELFNINSERYAFNEKGEMQTGVQTLAVKGGGEAVYYFGDDGAMKTGKQTIYDEDAEENQTWYFYPSGSKKGQGYTGERDNRVYVNGLMKKADPELRYEPVAAGDRTYLVNTSGTIQKASSSSTSDAKPELLKGFKDYKDSNDTVWTVDTNGIIQ